MTQRIDPLMAPPGALVLGHARGIRLASGDRVTFDPPSPDHVRPELLDDARLADAIRSLRTHLRSAYRELAAAHLLGAAASTATIVGVATILWIGPATLLDAIGGRSIMTAWDLMFWWSVLVPAAAIGGGYSMFSLARRARDVRGWQDRTEDLLRRLKAADAEQRRRNRDVTP